MKSRASGAWWASATWGPERENSHTREGEITAPSQNGEGRRERESQTERLRGVETWAAIYLMDEKEERGKIGGKCGGETEDIEEREHKEDCTHIKRTRDRA